MHWRTQRSCTRRCRIIHTSQQTKASMIRGLCSMLQLPKITKKYMIFSLQKAIINLISTFRVNHRPFIVSWIFTIPPEELFHAGIQVSRSHITYFIVKKNKKTEDPGHRRKHRPALTLSIAESRDKSPKPPNPHSKSFHCNIQYI